ncbi:hypothetical protein PtA15_6A40 [Puccinia triticina]|uniref:Uncharacterized protein n=1 Tax=Puccinia triticina TaxID=208348 RepID=A0ABY7CN53_9BASI|nr:uncharacterized protein PtA15_6A40 [Puccinia triticina]WAQ85412.1 hypothetical protein PtA15_6A40 [Puccinia triticina]WAR55301.1 hypothetical protein PtB15_6B40 [Puccinia triticina]
MVAWFAQSESDSEDERRPIDDEMSCGGMEMWDASGRAHRGCALNSSLQAQRLLPPLQSPLHPTTTTPTTPTDYIFRDRIDTSLTIPGAYHTHIYRQQIPQELHPNKS